MRAMNQALILLAILAACAWSFDGTKTACAEESLTLQRPLDLPNVLRLWSVQQELKLTVEQSREINAAHQEMTRTLTRSRALLLVKGPQDPEVKQQQEAAVLTYNEVVREVLSPDQLKRLEQLIVQKRVRSQRSSFGLLHPSMIEELGLKEDQVAKIRAKADKEQERMQERIKEFEKQLAQARDDAREALLAELQPEQAAKYKTLVGEDVELDR